MKGKITMTICVGCTALILTMVMFTQFKTVEKTDISAIETMREAELRAELSESKTKYKEIETKLEEVNSICDVGTGAGIPGIILKIFYPHLKLTLIDSKEKKLKFIDEVIKKVDIEDIKYSKVTEISSGQMQRVAIARALVKDSAMILADEPTGNLDSKNTKIVMDLLQEISKDRLVIVITHDDDAAHEYGDRIIAIEDGTILDDTTNNESINEYDPKLEKSTDFVYPKITLKQQVRFTKGFIRNSAIRSLAIFIMLILIPVIGNILCGYAFFDISTSYYRYQEKYGSNYVQIADVKSGYQVYYNMDEALEKLYQYGEENLYELYSTYIPLAESDMEADFFYEPVIKNIVADVMEIQQLYG